MPEQGHWEPCSDVEAQAALNEDGGRAQAECAGGWEAIHWDTCADCLYRTAVNIALTARPGRKFQRWVPTPFGVGHTAPDGCERWPWHAGEHCWRRADGHGYYTEQPQGALYFEFLCPDGVWRTRNAPTAWWGARCLSGGPSIGEGQWLTADAAIVRTV